jgi:hypothetical protein
MGRKKTGGRRGGSKKGGDYSHSIVPMMNMARAPTSITRVVLGISGTLSSDGAGVLAGAFTMDPSSCAKWSQYASIFDAFRVSGGVLKVCSVPSNGATSTNSICRFAFDNDSSGTPSAYSDVMSYSEIHDIPVTWSSGQVRTVAFRRPKFGVGSALWLDEQTPSSSLGALKFYANGLSVSTLYWHYVLEYLIEFTYRS